MKFLKILEYYTDKGSDANRKTIETHQDIIINLAKMNSFSVTLPGEKPKASATSVVNGASIFVSLEGIIDFSKEAKRLEKEINKQTKELAAVLKKLNNEDFLAKAPADVVDKVKEKCKALTEKQGKLQHQLDRIMSYAAS